MAPKGATVLRWGRPASPGVAGARQFEKHRKPCDAGHGDDIDRDAAQDVGAALGALTAADAGDDEACFVVEAVEDHELLWYDVSELGTLLVER